MLSPIGRGRWPHPAEIDTVKDMVEKQVCNIQKHITDVEQHEVCIQILLLTHLSSVTEQFKTRLVARTFFVYPLLNFDYKRLFHQST